MILIAEKFGARVVGAAKEKKSFVQGSTDPGVDQINYLKNHETTPQDNLISLISHEHSSHNSGSRW